MFRAAPGKWFTHPTIGLSFVAADASIANCGIRDQMFTGVRWPSGQRIVVVASSCQDAVPPGKPVLIVDNAAQVPCDV